VILPVVSACFTFAFKNFLTIGEFAVIFFLGRPFPEAILLTIRAPEAVRAPVMIGVATVATVVAVANDAPRAVNPAIIRLRKPPFCFFLTLPRNWRKGLAFLLVVFIVSIEYICGIILFIIKIIYFNSISRTDKLPVNQSTSQHAKNL
jgi:hypothetical protein